MQNQELESTFISVGIGKCARKWSLSLQIKDRLVAESPQFHEWGLRRRCVQTRRRRPTMVTRAGSELKSSQEFRKARWHHLWRGLNVPWSKGHILMWTANGSRDHATCARSVTQLDSRYWSVRNLLKRTGHWCSQAVLVVFDWRSRTPMILPAFARDIDSPKVECSTFVFIPRTRNHVSMGWIFF